MTKNSTKKLTFGIVAGALLLTNAHAQTNPTDVAENELNLNTVVYLEEDREVVLDFDTYFYLPDNFNPYEGMHFELDDIVYLECDEEMPLEWEPHMLLP